MKHWQSHPTPVEGCFGCHTLGQGINLSAEYHRIETSERKLRKDLDAYKAMRKQGILPRDYRDCDRLSATSTDRFEVENPGARLSKTDRQVAADIGVDVS